MRDRGAAEDAVVEELPHAEIADALDVPVGTVKSRLHRALRQELCGSTWGWWRRSSSCVFPGPDAGESPTLGWA